MGFWSEDGKVEDRNAVGQERKGAKAQRRKGVILGGVGRPPAPFGSAARSAQGSASKLASPFASLSSSGFARRWRTGGRVPRLVNIVSRLETGAVGQRTLRHCAFALNSSSIFFSPGSASGFSERVDDSVDSIFDEALSEVDDHPQLQTSES